MNSKSLAMVGASFAGLIAMGFLTLFAFTPDNHIPTNSAFPSVTTTSQGNADISTNVPHSYSPFLTNKHN